MKRCSTCNRTYTDPGLSFCIDDGTPLTPVESDETTVVRPRSTEPDSWNAVAYQPPGSYVPPGTQPKRRRAWPWVAGIFGAFLLGIVALAIAAAIFAPRLLRTGRDQRASSNVNRVESSTPPANTNANSNTSEQVDAPVPTDHEQVLATLKELENQWTIANLNADKKALDRILADDYVGQANQEGDLQSKAEYIRTIERDEDVEKWEFSDLKLTLAGDRATLVGTITYTIRDRALQFDFVDKFVWRDGRWQATGSKLKRTDNTGTDL